MGTNAEPFTVSEVRELAKTFDTVYEEGTLNSEIIEGCIQGNNNSMTMIMEFLVGCRALGLTQDNADTVYSFIFLTTLREMPKFINDIEEWKIAIAQWRLRVGK